MTTSPTNNPANPNFPNRTTVDEERKKQNLTDDTFVPENSTAQRANREATQRTDTTAAPLDVEENNNLVGTGVGAGIGGVAGAALTGGNPAGAIAGAAVGGVIGHQVSKN